ncbi:hypothetical protein R5R35_006213 [Gryllus longicercus]|uniref:Uncharacterized protein n=1 Tax=Gryllus longicercus TaxID=2509291 RepID=A0AAN9ZHU4_9ORTH
MERVEKEEHQLVWRMWVLVTREESNMNVEKHGNTVVNQDTDKDVKCFVSEIQSCWSIPEDSERKNKQEKKVV